MTVPAAVWIERACEAASGKDLLEVLRKRLQNPYDEGPALDDRRGEGPEEIFERLAKRSEVFRARLDETIAAYFMSTEGDPSDAATHAVTHGLLMIAQMLALPATFSPIRAWLERYEPTLRTEASVDLANTAFGALATAQTSGIADARDFWLRWWRDAPPAWQPRVFIGLRLRDPGAAVLQIPELLRRAESQRPGPAPLLHGLWRQPEGRTALLHWLNTSAEAEVADKVRRALRPLLPENEQRLLGRPTPRNRLRSLAPEQPNAWAY